MNARTDPASIACLALICSLAVAAAPRRAFAFDWSSWINPSTAPFLPVPEIDTDPDSGNTIGLFPTVLQTDPRGRIERILAPNIYKNSYFGWGVGLSVYSYPSKETQWWLESDIEQRVERTVDFNYQSGLLRDRTWSFSGRLLYDRKGTPRFFGVGNETTLADQTNYTSEEELVQAMPGWNISKHLQLAYMLRTETVDVTPGSLQGIPSIERRYAHGDLGITSMTLNRVLLIYDTLDDLNLPTRGVQITGYGGMAARGGFLNASLYSEAGAEARAYLPFGHRTVLALHSALRYLLRAHRLPFWALSSIGGDRAFLGGDQPLRGYGLGRFSDRDSFSFSAELREQVAAFNIAATPVQLQLAPFVDTGRVFRRPSTDPISHLHDVVGLGMRGIAPPSIVGYIDVGYGDEGVAVFTGINYPF
jgi:outer membrane translocation and assembly module TamA